MGMMHVILALEPEVDINELIQAIDYLNEKIMLIDSNVKFHFTVFWTVISIFIALLGIINWIALKKQLERKTEEYISKRLEEVISRVNQYKTIYGKKYLHENEYRDGMYSFEIGSDKLNINFKSTDNKIDIEPIKTNDKLDYKAEVIDGRLNIKLKNFIKEEHKGIEWRITYLEYRSSYLD